MLARRKGKLDAVNAAAREARGTGAGSPRPEAAEAAVHAERRRIARDLHDGMAQELAFIAMQARVLAARGGVVERQLAAAAERALSESRRVVYALADEAEGPLAEALSRTAEELVERGGARLVINVDPRAEASPKVRAALLRILREAVSNGIRHGQATAFEVELSGAGGLRLRIADNGAGFDPQALDRTGLGLVSMRERARALGGEVGIRSRPGAGCEVEVTLP
jgi:signal transduction histidine kinase